MICTYLQNTHYRFKGSEYIKVFGIFNQSGSQCQNAERRNAERRNAKRRNAEFGIND
jgi:hypothetical protein